ncbi:MAG: hypothetical protein IJN04_04370 [Clostridia bacterium]|nr:hypothetical protein [Clostridia bacterium]
MKHGEIQHRYRNHLYLSYRDAGSIKRMVGDIIVIVFFVDDSESRWTERDIQRYKDAQSQAMCRLMRAARAKGATLCIRNAYAHLAVDMDCERDNRDEWRTAVIRQYGKDTLQEYQAYYEAKYHCDEAPMIFAFNKPFRSYAVSTYAEAQQFSEMSTIASDFDEDTIAHELLHQFGARDLYFPRMVRDLVRDMGYESIMAIGNSREVDSLTAYLIGWTDEIDDRAVRILEATKHITRQQFWDMLRAEWGDT